MRWVLVALMLLVGSRALAEDALTIEVGKFTTEFRMVDSDSPRAANVQLAASKIDGVEVWPGTEFSYNRYVGERSEAAGFRKAHVIVNSRLEDDWGGGACQVASTLHAAVMQAGLKVTEEHPHSLPSIYMQPGLDSTVAWPTLDFRFRNDFQRIIKIHAVTETFMVKAGKKELPRGRLTVTLLSDRPINREVTLTFKTLKKFRNGVWKIKSNTVKAGTVVKQRGLKGQLVERYYRVRDVDGFVRVESRKRFKFAPLATIMLVPKG